jgi:hypothetical protein
MKYIIALLFLASCPAMAQVKVLKTKPMRPLPFKERVDTTRIYKLVVKPTEVKTSLTWCTCQTGGAGAMSVLPPMDIQ